jgi:2-polyprenyl-6-methoxyphenol hydroxylase-like FAD-dependent oxidoreductase
VVEQATFPKDTLSSHVIQTDALAFLNRLGVISRIRATGALFMQRIDARVGDFRFVRDFPQRDGDVGGGAAIRRHVLDPILAEAAAEAGAEVRMAARVVGLSTRDGRVTGVRVADGGSTVELGASLVVGADGRRSTVARLCGAREYNLTRSERWYYWTYFEGADLAATPTFVYHRWGDRMVFGGPSDSGLYLVGVSPEAMERDRFRTDLAGSVLEHAYSCEPIAAVLDGARRATKIFGIKQFVGYFREACGPGWVLVGDAGHFKDPAVGRGIGDAFLQLDTLAPVIVDGLDGSGRSLDDGLARWARWRDHKFAGHYWLSADIGAAGPVPAIAPEVVARLHEQGEVERFLDMLSHRARYYEVFTAPRLIGATGRVLLRRRGGRRVLLKELLRLGVREGRRRWLNRHPSFAEPNPPDPERGGYGYGRSSSSPSAICLPN